MRGHRKKNGAGAGQDFERTSIETVLLQKLTSPDSCSTPQVIKKNDLRSKEIADHLKHGSLIQPRQGVRNKSLSTLFMCIFRSFSHWSWFGEAVSDPGEVQRTNSWSGAHYNQTVVWSTYPVSAIQSQHCIQSNMIGSTCYITSCFKFHDGRERVFTLY